MSKKTQLLSSLNSIRNDLYNDRGVFKNVRWSNKHKKQDVLDKLDFYIGAIEDGEMFDIPEEIGDPLLRASLILGSVLEEVMTPWDHICRAFNTSLRCTIGRFIKLY